MADSEKCLKLNLFFNNTIDFKKFLELKKLQSAGLQLFERDFKASTYRNDI